MSQPAEHEHEHEDEHVNLRPGQHDEGGHGGMATRELAAHQQEERAEDAAADAEAG
jgi:hypothetical protein